MRSLFGAHRAPLQFLNGLLGVELASFLIAKEWTAALRAEPKMNDDVGEGLGHGRNALTGLERCVGTVDLGLRSSDSLQPRLSHWGLSAPTTGACGALSARFRWRLPSAPDTGPMAGVARAESPSYYSLG